MESIWIAWTTLGTEAEASDFSTQLLDNGLCVCVQMEGPIRSFYHWQGKTESEPEYRLMLKFRPDQKQKIEDFISKQHPYDTPEWVCIQTQDISPSYAQWAEECP